MPTANCSPRYPNRLAILRTTLRLTLLSALWLSLTSANETLVATELDYRPVAPAGHMQPWSEDEAEILIAPGVDTPLVPTRVAQRQRPQNPERRQDPASQLPATMLENPSDVAEVLVVPQPEAENRREAPIAESRGCYVAPPLMAISTNISLPAGKRPTSAAALCAEQKLLTVDPRLVGAWAGTEFHWSATCSRHRPLYFEEINAERYGYTVSYCLQPMISAARFFATIPALPYKMAVAPPHTCQYTLGHYRPGSCAPRRCNRLPLSLKGIAVETGFIAGLILLVP